jgi:hypothetical protein
VNRRGFLESMLCLGVSAAVITTPGALMRVRPLILPRHTSYIGIDLASGLEETGVALINVHDLYWVGKGAFAADPQHWSHCKDGPPLAAFPELDEFTLHLSPDSMPRFSTFQFPRAVNLLLEQSAAPEGSLAHLEKLSRWRLYLMSGDTLNIGSKKAFSES